MSEAEVCQLAYEGNINELRNRVTQRLENALISDQSGRQPVHWACSGGHANIVEYLYQECSHPDIDVRDTANWTPLMIAVSAGRNTITSYLVSRGAQVNAVNSNGQSSLHYAASKDRFELAELLLENEACVNIGDEYGNTPLHRAASKGHVKMVKLLLSYNADPNFQDSTGATPLHLACEDENAEVAKLLVENGASLSVQNKEEKTPLDVAQPGLKRQLQNWNSAQDIMDYVQT